VGSFLIPVGTEVSATSLEPLFIPSPFDPAAALPLPLPMDATPLDEEAALQMLSWYGEENGYRLGFGVGIDREAMLAKARGQRA
jgi:hypothetical protein